MNFPELNEIVICKVTKITDFGVFASLLEYEDIEGFIHISQVSSTWIKNIHNHVKQNQMRAAKVLKVDVDKKHIDLSFSRINDQEEKRKISEYRLFLRAQGLLAVIAKELNITTDVAWDEIAEPILQKEPTLYAGFINIVKYNDNKYEIPDKYKKDVFEILSKNITIKDKVLSGIVKTYSTDPEGLNFTKNIFIKLEKDNPHIRILYVGPGKYEIRVTGKDYKVVAKEFDKISTELSKSFKKNAIFEIKKNEV